MTGSLGAGGLGDRKPPCHLLWASLPLNWHVFKLLNGHRDKQTPQGCKQSLSPGAHRYTKYRYGYRYLSFSRYTGIGTLYRYGRVAEYSSLEQMVFNPEKAFSSSAS